MRHAENKKQDIGYKSNNNVNIRKMNGLNNKIKWQRFQTEFLKNIQLYAVDKKHNLDSNTQRS